jgi:hypothetical protein
MATAASESGRISPDGAGKIVELFKPFISGLTRIVLLLAAIPLLIATLWLVGGSLPSHNTKQSSRWQFSLGGCLAAPFRLLAWGWGQLQRCIKWMYQKLARWWSRKSPKEVAHAQISEETTQSEATVKRILALPTQHPQTISATELVHRPEGLSIVSIASDARGGYLKHLFGDRMPSTDQVVALGEFSDAWVGPDEHWGAADCSPNARSVDLILETRAGSGTTSTLVAMALSAAAARGQRVVIVVGDTESKEAVRSDVEGLLDLLLLRGFVDVETLNQPIDRLKRGRILVGTILELNEMDVVATKNQAAADIVKDIGVMLIDDFGRPRSSAIVGRHVPFILNAHRTLSHSWQRPFQLVVATPELKEQAQRRIIERLTVGQQNPKIVPLRPFREWPTVVAVTAKKSQFISSLAAVVTEVESVIQESAQVSTDSENTADALPRCVIYLPGLDREVIKQTRDKLVAAGIRADRWQVVRTLRELSPCEIEQSLSIAVHRHSNDEIRPLMVAARVGTHVLCISIEEEGIVRSYASRQSFPLIASRQSRDLAVYHLRWLTRVMPKMRLIRRDMLGVVGLPGRDDSCLLGPRTKQKFKTLGNESTLRLDPPDRSQAVVPDTKRTEWSALWLTDVSDAAEELVRINNTLNPDVRIRRSDDETMYEVVQCSDADAPADETTFDPRWLRWFDPQGQELDRFDLCYADRWLVQRGDEFSSSWLMLARIERDRKGKKAASQLWRDDPRDPIFPRIDVRVQIEPHAVCDGPQGALPDGVESYRLSASFNPLRSEVDVHGLIDAHGDGQTLPEPYRFRFDAAVSVILIGARLPSRQRREHLIRVIGGEWDTRKTVQSTQARRQAWAGLTDAIDAALRILCPELPAYARVIAFRPDVGEAPPLLLVTEPIATQQSAIETIEELLKDSDLRKALRDAALRYLDSPLRSPLGSVIACGRERFDADRVAREDSQAIRDAIDVLCGWERPDEGKIFTSDGHRVGVIRSPAPTDNRRWAVDSPTAVVLPQIRHIPQGQAQGAHVWHDYSCVRVMAWIGDKPETESSSAMRMSCRPLTDFEDSARELRGRFGYDPKRLAEVADPHEYLASVGMRSTSSADFSWLVEQSLEKLRPLAEEIIATAKSMYATELTARQQVEALYAFVVSLKYGQIAPGIRECAGVRDPLSVLSMGAGDCGSASLLLKALIRAAKIRVRTGIVLTNECALLGVEFKDADRLPSDDFASFELDGGEVVELVLMVPMNGLSGTPADRRVGRVMRSQVDCAVTVVDLDASAD